MLEKMRDTQQNWMVFMDSREKVLEMGSFPHVHLRTMSEWSFELPTQLPLHRNVTKDTGLYIQSKYMKYACIQTLCYELDATSVLCWMEPDDLFFSPTSSIQLSPELAWVQSQIHTLEPDKVYIPGEWQKMQNDGDVAYARHSPHWRFGGNFLIGTLRGFQIWNIQMEQGIRDYYSTDNVPLVWDFNVMAWVEYQRPDWAAIWYFSPPNGGIFQLHHRTNLSVGPDAATVNPPNWPIFPGWSASSAARVETPWETVILIRYVNYYIESNGQYTFPAALPGEPPKIRTQNYAIVQTPDGSEFQNWVVEKVGLPLIPGHVPLSTGLEDVRLFYDAASESIRFVATTLEYSVTPKIMTGRFVVEKTTRQCVMEEGQVLASPGGESTRTRWEKNWIPIEGVLPENRGIHFIYKWAPLQIGRPSVSGELIIHTQYRGPFFVLQSVCGSSPFIRDTLSPNPLLRDQYVGVVHYCNHQDTVRTYIHLLVWLDICTLQPLAISQPFTFMGQSIEYCLSIRVAPGQTYECMISVYDRNPLIVHISPSRFVPTLWKD
jgi:hypothetical protein